MSSIKPKNAPLKEVIFELHWECVIDSGGLQFDAGFDLAQGKFADRLKQEFPLHRKLIPDGIPLKIFGAPMHQYWKGEFQWPVVQHGQGMIAVNDVEHGYEWANTYKPLIIRSIKNLVDSYEEPLKFIKIKLQYIDAWDIDDTAPEDFMKKNLQTEIINNYPLPGTLIGFNIQQSFELTDSSIMNLSISNGINNQNQKKSVVWTTTVEKQALLSFDDIETWVETAHSENSNMFKKMLNSEFYASLDK